MASTKHLSTLCGETVVKQEPEVDPADHHSSVCRVTSIKQEPVEADPLVSPDQADNYIDFKEETPECSTSEDFLVSSTFSVAKAEDGEDWEEAVNEDNKAVDTSLKRNRFSGVQLASRPIRCSSMSGMMDKEFLIHLVRNEPRLWDQRIKSYHNRDIKRELWESIGEQLSVKGEQAQITWQNLRDTFRKKHKIQHESGQESAASDKWPYFKSMLFLKDLIAPGPSSGNLHATEKENEPSPCDRSPTTASEKSTNDGEMYLSSEEREAPASTSSSVKADKSRPKRHFKKKCDYDSQALNIEKRKIDLFEQHVSRKQKYQDDDDYSFFMSLLPSVKQLNQLEKMRLRMKILGDVTEALEAHNVKNDER